MKAINLDQLRAYLQGELTRQDFLRKNKPAKGDRLRQIKLAAEQVSTKPLLVREGTWAAESLILETIEAKCEHCNSVHLEHNLFLLAYCVPHRRLGLHTVKYIPMRSLNHHGLHSLPRKKETFKKSLEFCSLCFPPSDGQPGRDILYVDHLYSEPHLLDSPIESKE
jgi:hypothetical protein